LKQFNAFLLHPFKSGDSDKTIGKESICSVNRSFRFIFRRGAEKRRWKAGIESFATVQHFIEKEEFVFDCFIERRTPFTCLNQICLDEAVSDNSKDWLLRLKPWYFSLEQIKCRSVRLRNQHYVQRKYELKKKSPFHCFTK
jgi:hypothetical protein